MKMYRQLCLGIVFSVNCQVTVYVFFFLFCFFFFFFFFFYKNKNIPKVFESTCEALDPISADGYVRNDERKRGDMPTANRETLPPIDSV